ncbi:uncharacterized protein MELLADRAFT_102435 [Melampsora larici-populina 98AG31]|uniref:Opine dehydrogenase domain-containing protein n=1 Tax=Melampsora larici-populina (strain 98AG31 / pathotype 3-4-7) TaxID=747676 RepID=F4R8B0_MELLP|nr:uncharacterized protein MELLADRAFT_102435 [Melampsora larici-populina 98AG31]EGG11641.1 hypothetical protein MELLADRAFT_102435 [Melampsora larici-populina 98AG31]
MNQIPRVGYIGCGAAGLTSALDFNRRFGTKALMFLDFNHPGHSNEVIKQGSVESCLEMKGQFELDFESNIDKFIQRSDWICILSTSIGHEEIIEKFAKHKENLKSINFVWFTGNGIGLIAHEKLEPLNTFESSSIPYVCSAGSSEDGKIKICVNAFKKRLVVASYHKPDDETKLELEKIVGLPIDFENQSNFLELILVTYNGLLHPPIMLNSQKEIQERRELYFYRDLMTKEVCKETIQAWEELCEISNLLKLKQPDHPVKIANQNYGNDYDLSIDGLRSWAAESDILNYRPNLPNSMKSRQLDEEMRSICSIWFSIGKALGVKMFTIESWLKRASEINDLNYFEIGRDLNFLGLNDDAGVDQIRERFKISST